jgi:hypothetical protein
MTTDSIDALHMDDMGELLPPPTDVEKAPEIDLYLDEPGYRLPQDEGGFDQILAPRIQHALAVVEPSAPLHWMETLDRGARQSVNRTKDWTGRCQEFARTMPGCPGGASSALAAWFGMPDGARVVGGSPEEVADEPGWQHFSRSRDPEALSGRFGHVVPGARPFANGKAAGWSTDALRLGWPDRVSLSDLYERWDHEYLGRGRFQNGLWLDVREPKPVDTRRYAPMGNALVDKDRVIHRLQNARDIAKRLEDAPDQKRITTLIKAEREGRKAIADAFAELRHRKG